MEVLLRARAPAFTPASATRRSAFDCTLTACCLPGNVLANPAGVECYQFAGLDRQQFSSPKRRENGDGHALV
ncbi:MAG: hypothetical protein ABL931_13710 [Usitatibacteraceae bacterium]